MSMTKEKLRNELAAHGVPLPAQSAKKGEYLKLFEEHIAPLQQNEFSSDEETNGPPSPSRSSGKSKKLKETMKSDATDENSLILEELNIHELSDDELFDRLQEVGVSVGPIVDSTRNLYQRKLAQIMRGDTASDSLLDLSNGGIDLEGSDAYSDSDLEEEPGEAASADSHGSYNIEFSRQSVATGSGLQSGSSPDLRRRMLSPADIADKTPPADLQDSVIRGDRHTPTPRRALHSMHYSSSSATRHVETRIGDHMVRDIHLSHIAQSEKDGKVMTLSDAQAPTKRSWLRLLLKIFFVILLCGAIFFIYQFQNWESDSNPYKTIEEAAWKAANAFREVYDQGKDTEETPKSPPLQTETETSA